MYFRVRNIAGKTAQNEIIVNISKMSKIEELKSIIFKKMEVEIDYQVLLYKGKQLIDGHKIIDYGVQLNDVIQLIVKSTSVPEKSDSSQENKEVENADNGGSEQSTSKDTRKLVKHDCEYYKINDLVDVIDKEYGAWFEAKLVEISQEIVQDSEEAKMIYKVQMERGEINDLHEVGFTDIRPRSYHTFDKPELKIGMVVLASYNIEDPKIRGYWYDMEITEISDKSVTGTIFVGNGRAPILNCKIKFNDELMRIEKAEKNKKQEYKSIPPLRKQPYNCNKCKDIPTRKCKNCGCTVCGGKENPETIIMCDECDNGFHLGCLNPPLTEVPTDPEWYCPDCKNDENEIVKAGDRLKFSNKKAKMASNKDTSRDWGSGMACVGRTKECTIVPKDHYGPVPGVEVGTCWKFRLQASEAGIHRPHVAGIHGRESDGAYSLVLSGGYEDDIDNGEEFYYTGSGGRDLSGNKRVNDQSCDQKLTRMNKALALNCSAKFNDTAGAEAKDWKKGKPVRVVRNYKLAKHSKYAPKDGNRYDGIYKVVKYYPEKGKSGFIVWRYLLRRDDATPAPWAKNGQEFDMIYPDGYLEAQQAVETSKPKKTNQKNSTESSKRKLSDFLETPSKKAKVQEYKLSEKISKQIKEDVDNEKYWKECKETLKEGKQKFLDKVTEVFMCICCQEVVYQPITTSCSHNICKACLNRSFKSKIFTCPYCRFDLGEDYEMQINEKLGIALQALFPGYEAGR